MALKILITGRPGIGKTTIVQKAIDLGITVAGGFITEEIRKGGHRVGFSVRDISNCEEAVLSHVDYKGGPRVGKYGVDVGSFDRVGVAALRDAMRGEGCIVVDEIGKMELCSQAFQEAVTEAMDSGNPLLGTIPAYRHPFLNRLRTRTDVILLEATASNRDELPGRIAGLLGLPEHLRP